MRHSLLHRSYSSLHWSAEVQRERERCAVIRLSFTSGAPSLRQALLCLPSDVLFLVYPAVCCAAGTVLQRETYSRRMRFVPVNIFRFSLHVATADCRLGLCCAVTAFVPFGYVRALGIQKYLGEPMSVIESWCIPFYTSPTFLISLRLDQNSSASLISEASTIAPCL